MTELELHKLGFRSQEHYDEAMNAVKFAGSGKYSAPGGTGLFFSEKEQSLLDQRKQLASNCDDWLSYKSCSSADMFPPSCDLSGGFHSHIFNQGNRGSCLAQTLAALASYYFGQKEILSPEYIFACLKSYEHDRFAALYNDFFTKNPNPPALEKFTQIEKIKYAEQFQHPSVFAGEQSFLECWEKFLFLKNSHRQENFQAEDAWKEFAECIKVNEDPFNMDGASYDMAYQVFSHKGFASWDSWPYSAEQISGNSGHLPIPQAALADAEKRKITDQIYLFSSGGSIDEIKKFLTGNHGRQRPMPVAIGILCFNSWNCNPYTKKWGWINMPVYDEIKGFIVAIERNNGMSFTEFFKQIFSVLSPNFQNMIVAKLNENHCSLEDADPYYLAFLLYASEDGKKICRQLESDICYLKEKYSQFPNLWETPLDQGHAMLVVGYKDEELVPGGGYFIVRNSWGKQWAAWGEYPGHAKIPYAYIELFCGSAMSIIQPLDKSDSAGTDETPQDNRQEEPEPVKKAAAEAPEGKGTKIPLAAIVQTAVPGPAAAAAGESAEKEKMPDTEWVECVKLGFESGIKSNFTDFGKDYCFPGINLPFPYSWLPWQIPVKKCDLENDRKNWNDWTEIWIGYLKKKMKISPCDADLIQKTGSIRSFRLENGKVSFLVVTAFITPWQGGERVQLSSEYLECLGEVQKEVWKHEHGHFRNTSSAMAIIIGSADVIPEDLIEHYQGGSNEFVVYCSKPKGSDWDFRFPKGQHGIVWWKFVVHLLPVKMSDLVDDFERFWENMKQSNGQRLTPENLCRKWGKPEELFGIVISELKNRGKCVVKGEELMINNKVVSFDGLPQFGKSTGGCGRVARFFGNYIDEAVAAALTTQAIYICVGTNSANRYKVLTVLVLALAGVCGKSFKEMRKRKMEGK